MAEMFKYFDGEKEVIADPEAILMDIMVRTDGKPNDLVMKTFAVAPAEDRAKVAESWKAAQNLIALIRGVFKMQPFQDGTGADNAHCWKTWGEFIDFVNRQTG